jgi:ABC-2 type transport system ATP-binding protein
MSGVAALAAAARAAAASLPALSVDGVSHSYGPRRALDNVSFAVPQGRFTALLGLNGAGKTTLFSLITRLYDTRAGSISVLGHPVAREPTQALRLLGVVFQARTLDLDLSVRENLMYHAALHGLRGPTARWMPHGGCRAGRCGGWRSPAR